MDYCELERNYSCHDCPVLDGLIDCHNNLIRQCPTCREYTIPAEQSGRPAVCPRCT